MADPEVRNVRRSIQIEPRTGERGSYWLVKFLQGRRLVLKWRRMGLAKIGDTAADWAFNGNLPNIGSIPDTLPPDDETPTQADSVPVEPPEAPLGLNEGKEE